MSRLLVPAAILAATLRPFGGLITVGAGPQPLADDLRQQRDRFTDELGRTWNANSFAGVNFAAIAEDMLEPLTPALWPAALAFQDFSNEVLTGGAESVTTQIPGTFTAGDVTDGWTFSDASTTAVTIALDGERGFAYQFKDNELQKAKRDPRFLMDKFVKPSVKSIGLDFTKQITSLWNLTNYDDASQKSVTANAAASNYNKVVDYGVALGNRDVPNQNQRFLIHNPAYHGNLLKDSVVLAAVNGGNKEMVEKGFLGLVAGFQIAEFTALPANASNLVGVAGDPRGQCVAARKCHRPDDGDGGAIEDMEHPDSGFPFQMRMWYDRNAKKTRVGFQYKAGFVRGIKLATQLICSS